MLSADRTLLSPMTAPCTGVPHLCSSNCAETVSHLVVVPAGEQADVVDHGEAGGEELNRARHEVVPGVAVQRREVGAVVLVGVAHIAALTAAVEVLHIGVAAQAVLHHLLQLLHVAHLAPAQR